MICSNHQLSHRMNVHASKYPKIIHPALHDSCQYQNSCRVQEYTRTTPFLLFLHIATLFCNFHMDSTIKLLDCANFVWIICINDLQASILADILTE